MAQPSPDRRSGSLGLVRAVRMRLPLGAVQGCWWRSNAAAAGSPKWIFSARSWISSRRRLRRLIWPAPARDKPLDWEQAYFVSSLIGRLKFTPDRNIERLFVRRLVCQFQPISGGLDKWLPQQPSCLAGRADQFNPALCSRGALLDETASRRRRRNNKWRHLPPSRHLLAGRPAETILFIRARFANHSFIHRLIHSSDR